MGLLTFTEMTPEDILSYENGKQVRELITPKEKFDRFVKSKPIKKFHFVGVEIEGQVVLFNGLGEELNTFPNDLYGKRAARSFAVDLFNSFPPSQAFGGYYFDFI